MQNHYNLVYREEEREMIPLCLDQGVGVHPVEPAGARPARRQPEPRRRAPTSGPADDPLADEHLRRTPTSPSSTRSRGRRRARPAPGAGRAGLAARQPGVTAPIVGATKLGHLDDAIAAVDVTLSERGGGPLEAPYRPHPIIGHS